MALSQVYWNRTRRLWSVRVRGLVTAHVPALALADCRLHAGESARLRCLRTGDRDVHAWIAGEPADGPRPGPAVRIGYRPSETGFRRRDTQPLPNVRQVVRAFRNARQRARMAATSASWSG